MFPSRWRWSISLIALFTFLAQGFAQDDGLPPKRRDDPANKPDNGQNQGDKPPGGKGKPRQEDLAPPGEDYRAFFRAPETIPEFWHALQFEIGVGKYDIAAKHLRGLLAKRPSDADLVAIEESDGMAAFLRLRSIRQWSDDPEENARARKNANELVSRVTAAVKNYLGDPVRLRKLIRALQGQPEERSYAVKELYRSGTAAIPFLIETLRAASGDERQILLHVLLQLRSDIVPLLLAALDIPDSELRWELIDVLEKRAATNAVPFLWYIAGSPRQSEALRKKATEALSLFLHLPADKLLSPKIALTRQAEQFYRHQISFTDPEQVVIWRWDGKQLVAGWPGVPTVSASQAEEYYGLRFAREALDLDPAYQPAQLVFVSLALDKAIERVGPDQPLSKAAPAVHNTLATSSPELLLVLLDQALTEQRVNVILGIVRTLGELAERRAARSTWHGDSILVRALYYPDPRVQLAAAEAILRIPGPSAPLVHTRVVEVLRRAVAALPDAQPRPKVLVAFANQDVLSVVATAVQQAGCEPVPLRSGQQILQRINAAADLDLLLVDSALPTPGLSFLLAQLRADVNAAALPLILTVEPDRLPTLQRYVERYRQVYIISPAQAKNGEGLRYIFQKSFAASPTRILTPPERQEYAEKSLIWLARLARGEIPGYDVLPATDAVVQALRSNRLSQDAFRAALEVAGRLPGIKVQTELAAIVLSNQQPVPLRKLAAQELVRDIQRFRPLLSPAQVQMLNQLYANQTTEPQLKASVALVLGSLHPDARLTGERLRQYNPVPVEPPAAPAPAPRQPEAGPPSAPPLKDRKGESRI